jgi:integrase
MRSTITKRSVDSLTLGEKDKFLWDSKIPGFGLKVTPAGSRIYVLQCRVDRRLRRYTIGRHGAPWTPDNARKEARRLLNQISEGNDPAEAKSESRNDISIAELCDRWLVEGSVNKKLSTLEIDRSNIERHIKPLLGKKSVRSVTRADVEQFQRDVAVGKTAIDERTKKRGRAIVKGGKGTAARVLGVLSAIFNFAVDRELRPDNPARRVVAFKGQRQERFLSATEIARLGDALTAAKQNGVNAAAVSAIRLLLLTGARKSEILRLRWDYVDFERGVLRLPDSKTGPKTIHLNAPAAALLSELPRVEGNPYVIPGQKDGAPLINLQKPWRLIRAKAGLDDVRLHDLRHSFASVGAAAGLSLPVIGALLGHTQAATTQRYAHLADDPLKRASDLVGQKIANALTPNNPGASN